jgi:hypothetical protein
MFSNILGNPKTSIAGLLIGIATIAGVLSQQGVSLGNAGTGTVVSLIAGIATALLGLLAKDPDSAAPNPGANAKIGVLMLCVLLVSGMMPLAGCSGVTVAQDIVNWTPALQAAVATVDSTASLLAPADAPVFVAATVGFDAASNLLVAQAKAYLANPTASILTQLQTQAVTFQQQVNAALLAAGRITDPASQQHAVSVVGAVTTIVSAILALVSSISSKAAVARMAAQSTIKLAQVEPLLDLDQAALIVAAHNGSARWEDDRAIARFEVTYTIAYEQRAGF